MKIDLTATKGAFTLKAKADWPDSGTTVIAGPSGAGKSSLLHAILGIDRAQGAVMFNGDALQDNKTFVPLHKRRMAWVSQHDDVFAHQSVRENLRFAERFAAPGGMELSEIAERFSLKGVLDQNAGTLSGGQKQRLILARALLSNPRLLTLDEPFGALDAEARHELLGLLQSLCVEQNLPLLFVSHDFDTLTRLADHMAYMEDGQVVAQGGLNACLLDTALPFRYREDACVIRRAKATAYNRDHGLNRLDLGGADLFVPGTAIGKGMDVRLRLRAGDISLSRSHHQDSSVLNILAVEIEGIEHANQTKGAGLSPGLVNVTVSLHGATVLVRITEKSARALALNAGDRVFAQIKASALVGG